MSDADRSECWFLKFKSDVGIGRACNRTGDTCFPFLLRARRASEASAGFLNFNRTLGSGALATGQETLPIRVLGSACFFCFLFSIGVFFSASLFFQNA